MGAGVAGLRAAVELARHGEVLVVTKESVDGPPAEGWGTGTRHKGWPDRRTPPIKP